MGQLTERSTDIYRGKGAADAKKMEGGSDEPRRGEKRTPRNPPNCCNVAGGSRGGAAENCP